jgi:hypothetical protein
LRTATVVAIIAALRVVAAEAPVACGAEAIEEVPLANAATVRVRPINSSRIRLISFDIIGLSLL